MRRHIWVLGILVAGLVIVPGMVGCGKKPQAKSGVTESAPSAPVAAVKNAVKSAGPLGDLMQKQMAVKSYVMIMDMGPVKMRSSMKLDNGKPVRIKSDMGSLGWTIMHYDKNVQYTFTPAAKGVISSPIEGPSSGAQMPGPAAMPSAEVLKSYKVTSEKLDGVDCLKVTNDRDSFWLEKEHGLAVQIEMGGKSMKLKYEQINAVPDSAFELPAGVKVTEAPKAGGQ